MTERVIMWCDTCRGSDTDPRHHVMQADGTVQTRHMDCCRDQGCVDKSCDSVLEESSEARGDKLLAWCEARSPFNHEPVLLTPVEE